MDENACESSVQEPYTLVYELNDGAPVSSSLHHRAVPEDLQPCSTAEAPTRVPFGDISSNYADYYAPFLESAATGELKSPTQIRRAGSSRFSPNRPPGSGAAKRLLWSKDLPPLPPPAACQEQPPVPGLADEGEAAARDASPTRHTLRTASATEARSIPPVPNAGSSGGHDVGADLIRSLSISGAGAGQRWSLAHRGLFGGGLAAKPAASGWSSERSAFPFPLPTELGSQAHSGTLAPRSVAASPDEADENADSTQPSNTTAPAIAGVLGCALPR